MSLSQFPQLEKNGALKKYLIYIVDAKIELKYIKLLEECLVLYMVRSLYVNYYHFSI